MPTHEAIQGFWMGGGIFLGLLLLQIALWRWRRPGKQMLALFLLFFLPPVLLLFFFLPAAIFLSALSVAYVMTFPAIQAESPSLILLNQLRARGGRAKRIELSGFFNDRFLLRAREQDLATDGLVGPSGKISRAGITLAKVFEIYRKLMGIKGGTG